METIGDCYVAATGIPKAQPLHAVIMVKFAHDCIEKIHVVTQEIAGKLGEDTMDLAIRVGINSGSTTAGVLRYVSQSGCLDLKILPHCLASKKCRPLTIRNSRGEKGRFQLFGDTGRSFYGTFSGIQYCCRDVSFLCMIHYVSAHSLMTIIAILMQSTQPQEWRVQESRIGSMLLKYVYQAQ